MNRKKSVLCLLLITCMTIGSFGCSKKTEDSSSDTAKETTTTKDSSSNETSPSDILPVMEGDRYRDFTVTLLDGSTFTLSEHEGSVIFLNFWATWCGPCVNEMPAFTELQNKYGDQITMLAVNAGEASAVVEKFATTNNYTFPIALDEDYTAVNQYPTDGIPYTVIIGKDGIIAHVQVGAQSAEKMFQIYSEAIDKLL